MSARSEAAEAAIADAIQRWVEIQYDEGQWEGERPDPEDPPLVAAWIVVAEAVTSTTMRERSGGHRHRLSPGPQLTSTDQGLALWASRE